MAGTPDRGKGAVEDTSTTSDRLTIGTAEPTGERAPGGEPAGHGEARRAEVAMRLRRIEGQVAGVRKMYENGRYCIEVLDQLSATRAALGAVALVILEDHVSRCVKDAITVGEGEARAAELLSALRRYLRAV